LTDLSALVGIKEAGYIAIGGGERVAHEGPHDDYGNDALVTISGFEQLESVNDIAIVDNDNLVDLGALAATKPKILHIVNNAELACADAEAWVAAAEPESYRVCGCKEDPELCDPMPVE
jgi:hypothetical protein